MDSIKQKNILFVFFHILILIILSCNQNIYKNIEQYCVFLDNGLSGKSIYMKWDMKFDIDSLCVNSKDFQLTGFDLEILPAGGNTIYLSSNSNKLSPNMRAAIADYPSIECLVFKNFKFSNNGKSLNKIIRVHLIEWPE